MVEKFCNHFAGAFLVPKKDLREHNMVKSNYKISNWNDENLEKLSREFKVSKETILRRLTILGIVSEDFYKTKHLEWVRSYTKRGARGWRSNPAARCIKENSVPFVSLVVEAHHAGAITLRDVGNYLSTRLKNLKKIERLIESGI
jgi:Zn-dependent peptidase ImmA (M78 family)